jgi:hypothetical protein
MFFSTGVLLEPWPAVLRIEAATAQVIAWFLATK